MTFTHDLYSVSVLGMTQWHTAVSAECGIPPQIYGEDIGPDIAVIVPLVSAVSIDNRASFPPSESAASQKKTYRELRTQPHLSNAGLRGSQRVSAGLSGSQRVSAGLSGSQWVSVSLSGSQRVSVGLSGSQQVSEGLSGSRWVSVGFGGYQHFSRSPRVPRVSRSGGSCPLSGDGWPIGRV